MALIVLILESIIFIYLDFRFYGTRFTPIILLTIPFIGIVLFNLMFGESWGFYPLYLPSLWYWNIGIFVFWLSGNWVSSSLIGIGADNKNRLIINGTERKDLQILLRTLSIFLLTVVYVKLIKLNAFDVFLRTDEFRQVLGTGFSAHANVLLRIPIIYFLIVSSFKKKHLVNWGIIILWFAYNIMYNKSGVAIPFISGLFGRYILYNKSIKLKSILIIVASGVFLFWAYYTVAFGFSAPFSFVKHHFVFYTYSGLLSFSEYVKQDLEMGVNWKLLYQPIFNIYNALTGKEAESVVSDLWIRIDDMYENGSNVKTFFGSIFIYGGWFGGIITSAIWGAGCYLVLSLTILTRNIIFFTIYLLVLATLFFGWFDVYFNGISYYEILFFWLMVIFIEISVFNNGKLKVYDVKTPMDTSN